MNSVHSLRDYYSAVSKDQVTKDILHLLLPSLKPKIEELFKGNIKSK